MSGSIDRLRNWWDNEEPFAKTLLGVFAVSAVLGLGISYSVDTPSEKQPTDNTIDTNR